MAASEGKTGSARTGSCNDGQQPLSSLIERVENVQRAYVRRGGVFPVSFTGSIDDLRTVAARSAAQRTGGARPSRRRGGALVEPVGDELADGASVEMMCNDLSSFNDEQLNEWTKIFQEYWLTMLKTAKELLLWHAEPAVYRCSMKSDPAASKSFLSLGNLPFARLSLERILLVFEEDGAKPSETDEIGAAGRQAEAEERLYISDSPVFRRLSFENKYLARRLIQGDLNL